MIRTVALVGVTRMFGVIPGVVRVDLTVEPGEVVLIRGPNGAGKSTLLRIVATALSPTYGAGTAGNYALASNLNAAGTTYHFGLVGTGNAGSSIVTAFDGRLDGRERFHVVHVLPFAIERREHVDPVRRTHLHPRQESTEDRPVGTADRADHI